MPLSDRKMFELFRQREAMKAKIADINKRIKKRDEALLAEFERRGTKSLTDLETGEHITYVQSESVVYNSEELEKRLRRSASGKTILARCQKTVIDMKAIAAEVQAGNIKPEIVAACSEVKKSAPYVRGSQIAPQ